MRNSLRAHFDKAVIEQREELILKYVISLIKDYRTCLKVPYFLVYGILDWSWCLRFVEGNEEYRGFRFYSGEALAAINRGEKKFTRDHIFPKKYLKKMLLSLSDPTPTQVREMLSEFGEICVITREEDKKLRSAGLASSMPDGWNPGDSLFSRYEKVGIKVVCNEQQFCEPF